jgi:hypothetical protein
MGLEARVAISGTDNCISSNCYVGEKDIEDPSKIKTEWFSGFPKKINKGNVETFPYKYNGNEILVNKYRSGNFYYRYVVKKERDGNGGVSSATKGIVFVDKPSSSTDGESAYKNMINKPGVYFRCLVRKEDAASYFTRAVIISNKPTQQGKYKTGTLYAFNVDKNEYEKHSLPLVINKKEKIKLGNMEFLINHNCSTPGSTVVLNYDNSLQIIDTRYTNEDDQILYLDPEKKRLDNRCFLLTAADVSDKRFELLVADGSEAYKAKISKVNAVATGAFCHQ